MEKKGRAMPFAFKRWFPCLLVLITAVSLYDTFLIVNFRETIGFMEENPVGVWLLQLGSGDVGVFVRAKLAGTVIVISTLMFMYQRRAMSTIPVTTSIAVWQLGLFAYITFA